MLEDELAEGQRYRHPGRYRQWLLGRAVAKALLLRHEGRAWSAAAARRFRILREDAGWPRALYADGRPVAVSLSISHSGDRALCALGHEQNGPVGADLEKIEARSEAFLEDFYTEGERRMLSALSGRQRDTAVNAIWCLKESLLKALWSGLRRRATDVEVESLGKPAADGWQRAVLRLAGTPGGAWGCWRPSGDGLFCLALGRIFPATS